jgi:xanthine dehydrogenase accessory factor
MRKDLEIWRFAAEKLKCNRVVMLLVVTESSGSSPGRRGFKMAVAAGDMSGSVGGGVMEVGLVKEARRMLAPAEALDPYVKEQVHQKHAQNSSGMICSGKQTVFFLKLDTEHLQTIEQIIKALETNEPKILRITRGEFTVLAQPEGGTQNEDPAELIYEEELGCKNKLFIIGGGHCALALSELMSKMDFYVALFDDRPNLNTIEKNNYAHEIKLIDSYDDIDKFIPDGKDNFVVVMTLGYRSDEVVIRKLLGRDLRYFGVLGSKAKMKTLLKEMEKDGFSRKDLGKIRAPIGLPINSQTPEEIAVSIAAEIIAVKNYPK